MKFDTVDIQKLVNKRVPFLDQVLESDGRSLTGIASVSMGESFFQGHFPGNPVMPGVLIIETMVEACEILLKKEYPFAELSKIKKARFREMVKPGSMLTIKVRRKDKEPIFEAQAFLKDKLACSAELIFQK